MKPTTKKPRLSRFSKKSYVSQSALANVLTIVRDEGLPEAFSRGTQYKQRKFTCHEKGVYGSLVEVTKTTTKDGREIDIPVQNPSAMLYEAIKESGGFRYMFRDVVAKYGNDYLYNIVLYTDGISPADGLTAHDQRKCVAVYWSLFEFGPEMLAREEVWFVASALSTKTLKQLDGGLSHALRHILVHSFFGADRDMKTAGIFAPPDACFDEPVHVRAKIGVLLSDLLAFEEALLIKGHNGYKLCCGCQNVWRHTLENANANDWMVPSTCIEKEKIVMHTDRSVKRMLKNLADRKSTMQIGEFRELEVQYGHTYNEHSLLACSSLDIGLISCLMYDWMHLYVVGGLLDEEMGLLMYAFHACKAPTTYAAIGLYVTTWFFPKRNSENFASAFDSKAAKSNLKSKSFSCNASQLLTLAPVLRRYFVEVAMRQGIEVLKVESIIACIDVVLVLQAVKKGKVSGDVLHEYVHKHLTLFQLAYKMEHWRPKHHCAFHLGGMLMYFGMLISCFVHERKHRVIKKWAYGHRNTTSYELGMLEEVTVDQLQSLQDWQHVQGLTQAHPPSKRLKKTLVELCAEQGISDDDMLVSRQANSCDGLVCVDDFAFALIDGERCVVQVLVLVRLGGSDYAVVSVCVPKGSKSPMYETHLLQECPALIKVGELLVSLTHARTESSVVVLVPFEYQT